MTPSELKALADDNELLKSVLPLATAVIRLQKQLGIAVGALTECAQWINGGPAHEALAAIRAEGGGEEK